MEGRKNMLQAPRFGDRTILAQDHGRALVTRPFFYPPKEAEEKEREVTFSAWNWLGESPAMMFPVTDNNEVVAVRQWRHAVMEWNIEMPGGIPKKGESPQETVEREVLEETGYKADRVIKLEQRGWVDPPSLDVSFHMFIGVGCKKILEPKPGRNETMETLVTPFAEWFNMIRRGKIEDLRMIGISFLAMQRIGALSLIDC